MPRSRNIKPGFFQNENLIELPFETRLLFAGLWTLADRQGRLEDRPGKIKLQLFPGDSVEINAMLCALESSGFIQRYNANDTSYIQISRFTKHQNPHRNERESTIPAPDKHSTSTVQASDKHSTSTVPLGLIPDSLNLIPDSLKEPLSREQPATPPSRQKRKKTFAADIDTLFEFLNEKTGKCFEARRPNGALTSNGVMLRNLLSSGYTPDDVRMVVARKVRDWQSDAKMVAYLRPATLFAAKNFENYKGECVL